MTGKKQKKDYSTFEKMEIGISICDLFKKGTKTIDGCCQSKNVQLLDFYQWTKQLPELKEYYKLTKTFTDSKFDAGAKTLARKTLLQMLEGYTTIKYELKVKGKPKQKVDNFDKLKDLLKEDAGVIELTMIQTTRPPSDSFLLAIMRNVNGWH